MAEQTRTQRQAAGKRAAATRRQSESRRRSAAARRSAKSRRWSLVFNAGHSSVDHRAIGGATFGSVLNDHVRA